MPINCTVWRSQRLSQFPSSLPNICRAIFCKPTSFRAFFRAATVALSFSLSYQTKHKCTKQLIFSVGDVQPSPSTFSTCSSLLQLLPCRSCIPSPSIRSRSLAVPTQQRVCANQKPPTQQVWRTVPSKPLPPDLKQKQNKMSNVFVSFSVKQ